MARPKNKVCGACNEAQGSKYYASKDNERCLVCEAINAPIKAKQKVVDVAPAYEPEFPVVEQDYTDPSAKEIAARTLARRKLLHFIRRFKPKYLPGWVHEDICRRLERFMEAVERGEEPRLLLMCPPRMGKQLADSTPVPTPSGWRYHGDLEVGDVVFHPSGAQVNVLAVTEKTSSNVKVSFSDGTVIYCHENHEWVLYNRMRGEWQTVETNHFLKPARFGKLKQVLLGGRCAYQLPIVQPLQYVSEEYSMHPYVLGAWLGDGSAGKPCITGAASDNAITDKITALGYAVTTVCEHSTTKVLTTYFSGTPKVDWPGRMTRELQALGIYNEKRIPEKYLRLSIALRLELLAGLVDTDGTTDKNSRVTVTTVSLGLAKDIEELCEGLGFRPYVREVQPRLSTSGIQGTQVIYVVGFQPTMALPVALTRKRVTRFAKQRAVGLVSVERSETGMQGHCIEVDSPDGLYVVGHKLTATHNSEIGSRHFAPWVLGHHPDWEIIAASHTGGLTMSFSRYIRDLLRDPSYQALFPSTKLDPSSQSVENWNLTRGGGYLAAGVGTGITGRGAHILLLDDLVKDMEAADSQTQRDSMWEWYASTAYTRLAPGGGVLGIMTWWHEDDWAGRIQQVMETGEGDKFEIVKYPAINDMGDEYLLIDDSIVQLPLNSSIPNGSRMTRELNTAVHVERYSTDAMLRIKRNLFAAGQQRVWSALYQQNPTPNDGMTFTKHMFKVYSHTPQTFGRTIYQAWDFAITTKQANDWTVGVTVLHDENDDIFVLHVNRFRSDDGADIMKTLVEYAREWGCMTVGVEDGQIWKSLESTFVRICREEKYYPAYEVLQPLTDKMVRAQPLKGRMQAGKVWFPERAPWYQAMKTEFLQFPAGKHDDQVDSLAWVVRLILRKHPPRIKAPPTIKSWKDKLKGILRGQAGNSHMAS